ncbi:MAG: hypothetical protein QOH26_1045 [Actinomycetota bacterium]|jgi:hypothetical protein|nr:hypothetical protein [Actinomycetota bacterium]
MDKDELIAKLEELKPEIGQMMLEAGADEPDWGPLEKVLPMKWCDGFMYMGCCDGVHEYKHGLTRRTLALDSECRAYLFFGGSDQRTEVPVEVAVDRVFEHIEEMGYTRETALTEEIMEERRQRIADAGWTTITMTPGGKK